MKLINLKRRGVGIALRDVCVFGAVGAVDGSPTLLMAYAESDTQIDLSWTIGSTNHDGHKIERSTDGINYTEIATVLGAVNTYSDTVMAGWTEYYYRVRAYKGIAVSEYIQDVVLNVFTLLNDGNTVARFDRTNPDGVVADELGIESIYWDLNVGNALRGVEEEDGATVAFGVYEITACEPDHFFTGNQVGDIFPAIGGVIINGSNKVKRVLGNHLCQPIVEKRPINGVFSGSGQFMKVASFTLTQPEIVYLYLKQISTRNGRYIHDGNALATMALQQVSPSPTLRAWAGVSFGESLEIPVGFPSVIKTVFNGINSYIKYGFYPPRTGDGGTRNANGFTLASSYNGTANSNIEVGDIIIRKTDDLDVISNHLNKKHNLTNNLFDKGKVVFSFDDGFEDNYTNLFPLLQDEGITATLFIPGEPIGTVGFITWAQAKEMSDAGIDIQCHTWTYPHIYGNVEAWQTNEARLVSEMELTNSAFAQNNLPAPIITAYPGGFYNDLLIDVFSRYREMARTTVRGYNYTDNPLFEIKIQSLESIEAADVISAKAFIDMAEIRRTALTFMGHGVSVAGAANLSEIIDYAKTKNVDIINMSQLNALMRAT